MWLTINYDNSCHYCMAAHTAIAKSEKVDDTVTEALRSGATLEDARLQALRSFTSAVVLERGNVSKVRVEAFLAAGFTMAVYKRRPRQGDDQPGERARYPAFA